MIPAGKIIERLEEAISRANTEMDPAIVELLDHYEGPFSSVLRENAIAAKETGLPICQDTGFLEFFVFQGNEVALEEPIIETLNSAVKRFTTTNPTDTP